MTIPTSGSEGRRRGKLKAYVTVTFESCFVFHTSRSSKGKRCVHRHAEPKNQEW